MALSEVKGLGAARFRWLVDRFGSASAAVCAFRRGEPGPEFGGDAKGAAALRGRLRDVRPVSERRLRGLRALGIEVVTYRGPGYPESLTHLHHPPPLLFLRGPGRLPPGRTVAVVGTRQATEYGRRMARDLGRQLADQGCAVVSGMARGIDAAAHRGALDAGGWTLGILGCGLNHEYPPFQHRLYRRVAEEGLLVSEFAPDTPASAGLFPRRNRIIAALAQAVVVVQAGRRSGASITVGHALDLGREVFAVPGPVGPEASEGVHRLLREGAGLATCAADVLRELGWDAGAGSEETADDPYPRGDPRRRVLERLRAGPATADSLTAVGGFSTSEALAALARLEMEGRVSALAGGRYELGTTARSEAGAS